MEICIFERSNEKSRFLKTKIYYYKKITPQLLGHIGLQNMKLGVKTNSGDLPLFVWCMLTLALKMEKCFESWFEKKLPYLRAPMYHSLFIIFCNLLVHSVKFSKSFTVEVVKNIIGMLSHLISWDGWLYMGSGRVRFQGEVEVSFDSRISCTWHIVGSLYFGHLCLVLDGFR